MDAPEVRKFFAVFPTKYGTYLISLIGMGVGGVGIAGIILFGIAEDRFLAHFMSKSQLSEDIKKVVLLMVGISSLLLLAANALLFVGVTTRAPMALSAGVHIILFMCIVLILIAVAAPVSCFFLPTSCLVKHVSSISLTLFILGLTVFLEIWLYFMTIAWNHMQELGG